MPREMRQVWRRKTSRGAEDTSGGGRHIGRRKMHWKAEDASEGGGGVGSRSRVRDGKAWQKGVPLTASGVFSTHCGRFVPLVRHDVVVSWQACFGRRSRVLTHREGGGEGAKVREAREASGGGGEER